ncbi:MAG: Crp/Fnr family transcriptional regulator [Hahellaceae bacterium]|jgi:CRP-like cAMP-binding protein|nr:Crp/Fnr family transcriptional regulator [Hahellaceae bacterium]MCP5212576.1 Crp/Fnr family transcriptional regulator [Hahellaceae bacterium]
MVKPTIEEVRSHYLFTAIEGSALEEVLQTSRTLTLSPEQHIFMQGEEADHFYLVAEGQVKLTRLTMEGNEKVIEILQPGQSFAEAIMFMRAHSYPVTATALSNAKVFAFRSQAFMHILDSHPGLCQSLLGNLAMRLRRQLQEIENLTMKNASYRVVNFFKNELDKSENQGDNVIRLNVQKQVIASRLSIQPETLSRILANLKKQGIVESEGRDILIKDVNALIDYE